MRYLIVSLSGIGRRHLRNLRALRPDAQIAVLRQHAPLENGEVPEGADLQFATLEQALAFRPDAAIIAGPATTHLGAALPLAQAGVHLLIEKPLAGSLEGVDALVAHCKKNALVLMIGYNLRFSPSLGEVRRLIAVGAIGPILGARAEVGQYLPDWRPGSDYRASVSARRLLGGGVILELSHEFDYLYWMFGLPARVTAHGGQYSQLEIDVEDMVEVTLEYELPRRLINIHLDMVQRAPVRRCRFIGEMGTLLWDGLTGRIECYKAETSKWENLDQFACSDHNQMYLDELEHFFRCTEYGEASLVDGAQGRDVLSIAHAVRVSLDKTMGVELHPHVQR